MPAYYAHHRFGAAVAGQLEEELKKTIAAHRPQFDIGLQGPDIFFFYRPYTKNRVVKYGNELHHVSAITFFRRAVRIVRKNSRNSREYAYLLGFLCHFILDSECHPYVNEMVEVTGVKHLEIEEEFEKLLLRMDRKDPFSYPLGDLVPLDDGTVQTICPFYPRQIDEQIVRKSLQDLRMVKRLFTTPHKGKHDVINGVMKLSGGKYPYAKGLMNQRIDNPACSQTNEELLRRFESAVPLAVRMAASLDESIRTGKELDVRMDRSFA